MKMKSSSRFKDPLLLNASIDELSGIGKKRREAFHLLGLRTIEDILQFLPRAYIDRQKITPFEDLQENSFASIEGEVISVQAVQQSRLTVTLKDRTGKLQLIFFGGIQFLKNKFEIGQRINAWGRVTFFNGMRQLTHPELKILEDGEMPAKGIFPIYSRPEELREVSVDSKVMVTAVQDALLRLRDHLPENIPQVYRQKRAFQPIKDIYRLLHFPENSETHVLDRLRSRLKYEEAFFLCLKMRMISQFENRKEFVIRRVPELSGQIKNNAGFTPTLAQQRVLSEIENDLFSPCCMNRLLQGDVGSGKTFVCAHAAAHVVGSGHQVVLMAPTEILAQQHHVEMLRLFHGTGIEIALLTGMLSVKEKNTVLDGLLSGHISMAVGTHAVISGSVKFKALGLMIVDEQHRFGVRQRLALRQKGATPDVLVVSATPIPRTLTLTLYGDLKLSVIDELPVGRLPVKTHRVLEHKRHDMYGFVADKIRQGGRAFFVLPMIDESEKTEDVKSVLSFAIELKNEIFPSFAIDVLHGQLTPTEKGQVIQKFRKGECQILVTTTVIEVGIDIPDADLMVIEHPDRFGLAQLHQLRGRVGRGTRQSFCFLMVGDHASEEAQDRLTRFAALQDGFRVAELDFETRGPGRMSGFEQSGVPEFKFLDMVHDRPIIEMAKEDAENAVSRMDEFGVEEKQLLEQALKPYRGLTGELINTA